MKKTLIALALTSLPVAAMAEVVLYGQIKAGYEINSTKITGSERTPYQNGLVDYGSRIGFKGKEDLGNGLSAIWQVESNVRLGAAGRGSVGAVGPVVSNGTTISNGSVIGTATVGGASNTTNALATRDSFIGLEGGFGKIRGGLLSNYQNSDMGTPDAWEYGSEALGLAKYTRTGVRRPAVRYDSPNFAGFSFMGAYTFSDNANGSVNSNNTSRPNETRDVYNLGLSYENSGFFGKYAYEYQKNVRNSRNGHVHNLEAGYDANNLYVAGGFQYTRNAQQGSHSGAPGADRSKEVALTAGYHFGNVFPKISYAHGWNEKNAAGVTLANTKYDQIVIGADYDFSKRTTAMVSAGWLREGRGVVTATKANVNATTTAVGVGLRHKF